MLDDVLDRAVLAGGVAAFEDDQDAPALGDDLSLQLDELDLQLDQLAAIGVHARLPSGPTRRLRHLPSSHAPAMTIHAATASPTAASAISAAVAGRLARSPAKAAA